jgi:hypothetical protein
MFMVLRILFICLSGAFLFACSSKTNDPVVTNTCTTVGCPGVALVEEPTEAVATVVSLASSSEGLSGDITSVAFDSASQIFAIVAPDLNVQMNRFGVADFRSMLAMWDVGGIHNAYFADGDGTQVIIYSGGTAGKVQNLASFGRTAPSEMPLIGSAQFSGDYAGFTTTRRINGDAQLDVDFAANTVGGRITDRLFRLRPDNTADVVNPLSTIVLEETTLGTDGSFQGVTGGGQIVNGQVLWNPATGSFVGLIGGATGNEAVGTVALTHRSPPGGTFDEVGGFLATR